LKRNQANNLDRNYENIIENSKEVKINSRKADPSFDQGSFLAENYLGNEIPDDAHDVPMPSDDDGFDDIREV
jgi:hypothetical protein